MVVDDVKVMKDGCQILSANEQGTDEEKENKTHAAELILNVVENLDTAINLVKIGGFKYIIKNMIGSMFVDVRSLCASIFTTAVQNNPPVQKNALEEHALEGLFSIISEEKVLKLKEQYVSCISGLVRGEFADAREKFIDFGGIGLIYSLISQFESARIVKKSLLMLSDIFHKSRDKGFENLRKEAEAIGLINAVSELAQNNQDPEIVEMAQWVLSNSVISTQ